MATLMYMRNGMDRSICSKRMQQKIAQFTNAFVSQCIWCHGAYAVDFCIYYSLSRQYCKLHALAKTMDVLRRSMDATKQPLCACLQCGGRNVQAHTLTTT